MMRKGPVSDQGRGEGRAVGRYAPGRRIRPSIRTRPTRSRPCRGSRSGSSEESDRFKVGEPPGRLDESNQTLDWVGQTRVEQRESADSQAASVSLSGVIAGAQVGHSLARSSRVDLLHSSLQHGNQDRHSCSTDQSYRPLPTRLLHAALPSAGEFPRRRLGRPLFSLGQQPAQCPPHRLDPNPSSYSRIHTHASNGLELHSNAQAATPARSETSPLSSSRSNSSPVDNNQTLRPRLLPPSNSQQVQVEDRPTSETLRPTTTDKRAVPLFPTRVDQIQANPAHSAEI